MINAWDTDYRDPDELAAPWRAGRPAPLDGLEEALLWLDHVYRRPAPWRGLLAWLLGRTA